jgi:hypothetical protein
VPNTTTVATYNRLCRHNGCRTAYRAARTDQHGGLAVDTKHTGSQKAGEPEGAAQYRRVDRYASPANVTDVLKGQPKAVQNDAQTEQAGL